jgi:uncharacterized protein (TIGR03083 family)
VAVLAGLDAVLADLLAEADDLDRVVAGIAEEAWALPTPSPGWTVAHQIAHLVWSDERALLAVTDQAAFAGEVERASAAPDRYADDGAREGSRASPGELLARWRDGRAALAAALAEVPAGARLPWFGPPMGAGSMAAARLMETWAHGQDVVDALEGQRWRDRGVAAPPEAQVPVSLGVHREPTARLWHIARLGVRTRDAAFRARGLAPPAEPFRVELTAPDGAAWVFGPEDGGQRVTGPALGFCLLVTRRRHRDDTGVVASGRDADAWLGIAQAFAGPPGADPPRRADARRAAIR